MFFKTALALSFLLTLGGCAKIKQSAGAPIVIQSSADAACFADLGERMKEFLDGDMSETGVRAFWACASRNLAQYRDYTKGDLPGGAYSAGALGTFIQNYFLPIGRLQPATINGFMQFKRLFLGGDTTAITLQQFDDIQKLFTHWEKISLALRAHMGVLTERRQGSIAEVEAALQAAAGALADFGATLNDRDQDYAFADLEIFLSTFQGNTADTSGTYARLSRLLQMLPPMKTILLSGAADKVSGHLI